MKQALNNRLCNYNGNLSNIQKRKKRPWLLGKYRCSKRLNAALERELFLIGNNSKLKPNPIKKYSYNPLLYGTNVQLLIIIKIRRFCYAILFRCASKYFNNCLRIYY